MEERDTGQDTDKDTEQDTQYKTVRGLTRGLDVLRALNLVPDGRATVSELSARTQLHRATVRRLLDTLVADGFVRRSESDGSFQLTFKVRELSDGFTDVEWISRIATPIMGELLQKVVWPSDLCTLDGDSLKIRETTHRFSPLSVHRAMVGRRMPLLLTASGRAYFCNCEAEEREQILQLLRSSEGEQASLARDSKYIEGLIRRVRTDHFACNEGDWQSEKSVGAIALPIMHGKRVVATLSVVYMARVMRAEEACRKYGAALEDAVTKIMREMQSQRRA